MDFIGKANSSRSIAEARNKQGVVPMCPIRSAASHPSVFPSEPNHLPDHQTNSFPFMWHHPTWPCLPLLVSKYTVIYVICAEGPKPARCRATTPHRSMLPDPTENPARTSKLCLVMEAREAPARPVCRNAAQMIKKNERSGYFLSYFQFHIYPKMKSGTVRPITETNTGCQKRSNIYGNKSINVGNRGNKTGAPCHETWIHSKF
jgi:hypothetical protein